MLVIEKAKKVINNKHINKDNMEIFMKIRDFDKWLSTMNDSIATWKYYTDFEKVYKNAEKIKTEIYILNSLINSKNIREDLKNYY